jgi:hypothetical protein
VSKQEPVHRVNHKRRKRAVHQIKTDVAYLANLAERLSGPIGLPLNLAHERVMTLAVSAKPRSSMPFFGDRG